MYVCMYVCISSIYLLDNYLLLLLLLLLLGLTHSSGYEDQHGAVYADVCTLLVAQRRPVLLRRFLHGPCAWCPVSVWERARASVLC